MSIRLEREIICFGSTLAREMSREEMVGVLDHIPADRLIGYAMVIIARSSLPGANDVHYIDKNITPDQSIAALATALERRVRLHGKPAHPPIILGEADARLTRDQAEELVDYIRSGKFVEVRGGTRALQFDASREMCVRVLTRALATTGAK